MGVFVESQEILLRRASAAHGAGIPRIENSVKFYEPTALSLSLSSTSSTLFQLLVG